MVCIELSAINISGNTYAYNIIQHLQLTTNIINIKEWMHHADTMFTTVFVLHLHSAVTGSLSQWIELKSRFANESVSTVSTICLIHWKEPAQKNDSFMTVNRFFGLNDSTERILVDNGWIFHFKTTTYSTLTAPSIHKTITTESTDT